MTPTQPATERRRVRLLLAVVFLYGVAASAVMISRSEPGGDALRLLVKGWLLAAEGLWLPYGNEAGGGGFVPGGLSALLVGFPLWGWMDHRATIVPILLCHVVAYVLLDRVVRDALGTRARVVLALVYWMNPWRLYQTGWLDNSNYVFLAGAVHLWACYGQRRRPSLFHSAVLVGVVGLTFQLHLDALILLIATLLLWFRGYFKPHWGGVAIGVLVNVLSLVPFLLRAASDPGILPLSDPQGEGLVGSGFVQVWPVLKGLTYWFRYASISGSTTHMLHFEFADAFGSGVGRVLDPVATVLAHVAGVLSLVLPLGGNRRSVRQLRRLRRVPAERLTVRPWLAGYALWICVSCGVANGLSPIPTMWWHNLIGLHAAVLPVVLWVDLLLRSRRAAFTRRGLQLHLLLSALVVASMAWAGPNYRPGGRDGGIVPPIPDGAFLRRVHVEPSTVESSEDGFRIWNELRLPRNGRSAAGAAPDGQPPR